ncbi:MAG: hypothetical protein DMG39_01465 [Acidobacteria bacterium]|nr:MAG: hypothetical protein DMG39_01465 [Acidobacteriota bacterium]
MRYLRFAALFGVCLFCASFAHAQRVIVGLGVGAPSYGPAYIGPPPVCAYGYYDYYPYACAPYGYYGPAWFVDGVFVGVGPWYHWYYRHPGWYGRGFYGRGWHGDWDHDGGRGFGARGWDHDGFRGRGFDHEGFGRGGFHGGRGFHGGGGGFHGGGGHGGGHGGHH